MSIERQRGNLRTAAEEITGGIAELKAKPRGKLLHKSSEKSKKSIRQKLDKLNDQTKKDDVVTFEELGVDRLLLMKAIITRTFIFYTKNA